MKLVAKKDFANVKSLGITVDKVSAGFKHEGIIHKGYRFAIGTGEFYTDLNTTEQEAAGTLIKHGLAAIDNKENADNGVIPAIDKEVKAEAEIAAKAKKDAADNRTPTMAEVLELLTKTIEGLSAKK